jgi:hypothetical protein
MRPIRTRWGGGRGSSIAPNGFRREQEHRLGLERTHTIVSSDCARCDVLFGVHGLGFSFSTFQHLQTTTLDSIVRRSRNS